MLPLIYVRLIGFAGASLRFNPAPEITNALRLANAKSISRRSIEIVEICNFRGGDEGGMGGPCGVLRLQRALAAVLVTAVLLWALLVYWQKRILPLDHLPAISGPLLIDK